MSRAATESSTITALDPSASMTMDLSGIKLIEASAGTGKTHAIGNLYLRYVLAGCKVGEILVVTFTNAATEELRGRIRTRLYDTLGMLQQVGQGSAVDGLTDDAFLRLLLKDLAADPGNLERSIQLLQLAVRSMDEAAIFTLHGFCQRALSEHAFQSNQSYELELVTDDAELWDEAVQDWWRGRMYELATDLARLYRLALGSLERFRQRQLPMREAHDHRIEPPAGRSLDELDRACLDWLEQLQAIARDWQARKELLQAILSGSDALVRRKKLLRKTELPHVLQMLDTWFAEGELSELPPGFELLTAGFLAENRKEKVQDDRLDDPFFQRCQDIWAARDTLTTELGLTALHQATAFARQRVDEEKQRRKLMTFSDLLLRLRDALHGPRGAELADQLRVAFPVAMIDEFQDTDSVQYSIFRLLYAQSDERRAESKPHGLIMIGDPKQAIYSFRGGDIFTYMEARRDAAGALYTLDTNWRSVPELVGAVNLFFERRPDAFVYSGAIDFQRVKSTTGKSHHPLQKAGRKLTPFVLWRLPGADSDTLIGNKEQAEELIHQATASEVVGLISDGAAGQLTLGESRAVEPGDIAVLVRTKRQAQALRDELALRGVPAVTLGDQNVFESEEAYGLTLLLEGVVHCHERDSLRRALGSPLLCLHYDEIAACIDDEERWLAHVETLRGLHELWQQNGFMVMFQSMLQRFGIARRLTQELRAERALTNLLHLAELLQQNARSHPGMEPLLLWFAEQCRECREQDAEIRLESDERLVKIVTVHSSKGLQYPIVFCPYLSQTKTVDPKKGKTVYHDEQGQPVLDISAELSSTAYCHAEKERLAEDVRLLYVALTRAQARVYLVWGQYGQSAGLASARSALAWMLFHRQGPADLDGQLPDALEKQDGAALDKALRALQDASKGNIELHDLPADASGPAVVPGPSEQIELQPAPFTGRIATDWRIASFSALTRDVHQAPHGGSERDPHDPIISFPAGSHIGLFLHVLLEELDFQEDPALHGPDLIRRHAPRYGLDPEQQEATLLHWLQEIINTPLDDRGLSLSRLSPAQCLDELEFDFSVHRVPVQKLNELLRDLAGRKLDAVTVEDFRGLITGIIDLVFEYQGQYFIADYKSNFLGGQLADYAPEALEDAVHERRYDLQYWLYVLALHRYLQQRLPDYDPQRHIGGIYYLFLRGMRSRHGSAYGVYHRRPAPQELEKLDALLQRETPGGTPR